jgi:hypothetical protein
VCNEIKTLHRFKIQRVSLKAMTTQRGRKVCYAWGHADKKIVAGVNKQRITKLRSCSDELTFPIPDTGSLFQTEIPLHRTWEFACVLTSFLLLCNPRTQPSREPTVGKIFEVDIKIALLPCLLKTLVPI